MTPVAGCVRVPDAGACCACAVVVVATTDTVDSVLSYENIVKAVRAIVAASHFHLIETLAEKVAAECLTHYTVSSVKVKIEKPDIFPDAATVGIEIERP